MIAPRVLLVEDEPGLQLTLSDRLAAEGYAVDLASDGPEALAQVRMQSYDTILLDVMLPGIDGFEVARSLRAQGVSVPILMLTARAQITDRVTGLSLGADDYLTKPFDVRELLARIEALRRRAPRPSRTVTDHYQFGDVLVDLRRAELTRGGSALELSAKEFQLLRYFIEHRGATLSREVLLQDVWGYRSSSSTRTIDVHVAWLRQKLEPNPRVPQYIVTVHGLGYKFVA
jgi:two-component system alkaline phosphatase synthesis response regulator PhoP